MKAIFLFVAFFGVGSLSAQEWKTKEEMDYKLSLRGIEIRYGASNLEDATTALNSILLDGFTLTDSASRYRDTSYYGYLSSKKYFRSYRYITYNFKKGEESISLVFEIESTHDTGDTIPRVYYKFVHVGYTVYYALKPKALSHFERTFKKLKTYFSSLTRINGKKNYSPTTLVSACVANCVLYMEVSASRYSKNYSYSFTYRASYLNEYYAPYYPDLESE